MTLKVFLRNKTGKKVKSLRREEKIPAVLYGPGIEPKNLFVEKKDLQELLKKSSEGELISLFLENKEIPALIKEIQRDCLKDEILHLDFYQPPLDKPIETEVMLEFIGKAPAKEKGAVILKQINEIPIKALLSKLPKSIKIDLSLLKEIGDKICVKNIEFPEGVKPLIDPNIIIAIATETEKEEIEEQPKDQNEDTSKESQK